MSWRIKVNRSGLWRPWKYEAYHSGFGLVYGSTWRKRTAERMVKALVAELVAFE